MFPPRRPTQTQPGTCDDKQGPARELVTWEFAQKYFFDPTFGGALVPGQRNVFDSTVDLTGIAFLTEPRRFSPVISRFRMQDGRTDFTWALDYDPVLHQLDASTLLLGRRIGDSGKWYLAGGQTYMREPAETTPITGQPTLGLSIYNQYRVHGAVRQPGDQGPEHRRGGCGGCTASVMFRRQPYRPTTTGTAAVSHSSTRARPILPPSAMRTVIASRSAFPILGPSAPSGG